MKSWRPDGPSDGRAKAWLLIRRGAATLIALALVGWLTWLLLSPLFGPRTFLVHFCAEGFHPLASPPLEFTNEDRAGFVTLLDALSPRSTDAGRLLSVDFATPTDVREWLEELQQSEISPRDVVIVYVATHGIVRMEEDGAKAYLMCSNFDPSADEEDFAKGAFAVEELLQELQRIPSATKLLLLDAGRSRYLPRLGMPPVAFAKALEQELEGLQQRVPSVCVLSASSPGEYSHVTPAVRRSVFGYMVARGLQGEADANRDEAIQLYELFTFVQRNVAKWVETSAAAPESQTPVLLGVMSDPSTARTVHLLNTGSLPEVPSTDAQIEIAQDPERHYLAVNHALSEIENFGAGSIFRGVKKLVGGDRESEEPDEESKPEAAEQGGNEVDRDKQQRALVNSAWQLTFEAAAADPPPVDYAPHLWRRHLDWLVWMEATLRAGDLLDQPRFDRRRLIDDLYGVVRSLEEFDKPLTTAPRPDENVIEQIRRRRLRAPIVVDDAPTLAVAEAIAAADANQSLSERLQKFIDQYDRWLETSADFDALDRIAETSWDELAWAEVRKKYYELQLIDMLRDQSRSTGDPSAANIRLLKLALHVRRVGEQAVADLLWGQGWAADRIEQADGLRRESERLLLSRAASDVERRAEDNLKRAERFYVEAQRELDAIRETAAVHRELQSKTRDYLRWTLASLSGVSSRAPSPEAIRSLLDVLQQSRASLASPRSLESSFDLLQRRRDQLNADVAASVAELTRPEARKGDPARLAALLQTSLLKPDDRIKCDAAWARADQQLMANFQPASASETPRASSPGDVARQQFNLAHGYVRRFAMSADAAPLGDDHDLAELVRKCRGLAEQWAELPERIEDAAGRIGRTVDLNAEPKAAAELREAAEALVAVEAIDLGGTSPVEFDLADKTPLIQVVQNTRWHDLLVAAAQRRKRAQGDATPGELDLLTAQIGRLGELAGQIAHHQPPPAGAFPELELQVADSQSQVVALEDVDQAVVRFRIDWTGRNATPVWVMVEYDESVIAVEGVDNEIVSERDVRRALFAERTGSYPYQPREAGTPETFSLPPGGNAEVALRVRRQTAGGGNANLVVKAITPSEYVRQQIPLQLPKSKGIEMSVLYAGRTLQPATDGAYRLFPNRAQDIAIQFVNKSGQPKSYIAHLYAPPTSPAGRYRPLGAVKRVAAERELRRRFGLIPANMRRALVAHGGTLDLPASDEPAQVLFKFDSPENSKLLGAESEDGLQELPLSKGLLLLLVDESADEQIIRWLPLKVWKPWTYLKAWADYDPGSSELTVTVDAPDSARLPSGQIELSLHVDGQFLAAIGRRRVKFEFAAPQSGGTLSVPLLKTRWPRDGFLKAHVNVDGYPRAFEFRIPQAKSPIESIAPVQGTAIRIVKPANDAWFPATEWLVATVEVDTPDTFFDVADDADDVENYVEVGVDEDGDNEFLREQSQRLRADRQVELFAAHPLKAGTLAVNPRVGDFQIRLRTAGISGETMRLLALLRQDNEVVTESQADVIIDGEPPEISESIDIEWKGTTLIARVHCTDLTDVDLVQAGIDLGEAAKEMKWEEAKPIGAGWWKVEIKTDKLLPGVYPLAFRAQDAVGNMSDGADVEPVRIEEKNGPPAANGGAPDAGAPKPKKITRQIRGAVTYGKRTAYNLEVTLLGEGKPIKADKTDDDGNFFFARVPAGEYTLKVTGTAANRPRTEEVQVTVSDREPNPMTIDVELPTR